jgi:ABC-type dipeptide/oligopeptide/nickel transport system permease subunit
VVKPMAGNSAAHSPRVNLTLLLGLALLAAVVAAVLSAPALTPHDPVQVRIAERLYPPSPLHLLGQDYLGRDVLARLLYGGRISLATAAIVLAGSLTMGVPIGMATGYFGGRTDQIVSGMMDLILIFPNIVLVIFIAGVFGPSLINITVAFTAVHWVTYARLIRSTVLLERERDYVQAAQAAGASPWRIIGRHIAPNVIGPLLVWTTLDFGKVILAVAGLSFLGLGAQPPFPEWGAMLAGSRTYFQLAPQLMLYPGLAITGTALAVNLIGDGMRDRLDPQNRLDCLSRK